MAEKSDSPAQVVVPSSAAGNGCVAPDDGIVARAIRDLEHGLLALSDLQKMALVELEEVARHLGVSDVRGRKKDELVLAVLEEYVGKRGVLFGDGVAEILPDGFGFLRSPTYSYLPSPDDIYLSPALVSGHGLKTGMPVGGQIRRPQGNERYFALLRVEQIADQPASEFARPVDFEALTPVHPDRKIELETADAPDLVARVIDLLAPVGFGQRGLIVAPPRAGKTLVLKALARSIAQNHPDAALMMLLVDERPEEVTDMERDVAGEVVASTFDEAPARHVQVAEIVLDKAKRLVEGGRDVVILLDSITRLARAYNALAPSGGRILSGGVEANALQKPKRFFGAARSIEGGGSLTILATALVDTGSRMDDVIFEEFKGTGNMELVLDRRLAERRLFPAIDVHGSGTRMEERLLDETRQRQLFVLRQVLAQLHPVEAMELLLSKMRGTRSNSDFLEKLRAQ
jgi:transcription termination factor Rho